MRERADRILKIACGVLAALLLYRLTLGIVDCASLSSVKIPALPALSADTNAPAPSAAKGTNTPSAQEVAKKGTNAPAGDAAKAGTNSPTMASAKNETNAAPASAALAKPAAIGIASSEAVKPDAIQPAAQGPAKKPNTEVARPESEKPGTNTIAGQTSPKAGTNSPAPSAGHGKSPGGGPGPDMAMMGMGGAGPERKAAELAPAMKARVDRIYDSELFGPVMHPLPMALLGIAGNTAFLRTASGQTGLVKEGDPLGEIKLLKIGINRVLVEQDGEKKELTIFSGYGGQSLLTEKQEGAK